jgi:hypothetical protein
MRLRSSCLRGALLKKKNKKSNLFTWLLSSEKQVDGPITVRLRILLFAAHPRRREEKENKIVF